jgi:uncharacterized protein (DUF952 family)
MTSTIYKIVSAAAWSEAVARGSFRGSPIDLKDGFIHFSTAEQVRDTAAKHFAGVTDLVLVAVSTEGLESDLRWEPSRGGDLFPHLYTELTLASVLWVKPLPLGDDGAHVFPDLDSGHKDPSPPPARPDI